MSRYDFWTHGVNTIVQFPNRAKSISHSGLGTEIVQTGLPENLNWLHIPIPSPTRLNSTKVFLHHVRIRGSADDKAVIEEVQLLVDGESKSTDHLGTGITKRKFDQEFGNAIALLEGGLVISIRVRFLSASPGKVVIRGAGARFEQLPI